MRSFKVASVVLILVAGQALAQSVVSFELELGGDNHGARCVEDGGSEVFFTPGSPDDGQGLSQTEPITWDVRITANGVQQQGNGAGYAVRGVANFVVTLGLYKDSVDPANLVADVDFYSTVQDGNGGCELAGSAFAFSIDGNGWGPERVIDLFARSPYGGANMDVWTYPTGPPPGPPPTWQYGETGTLLGMGAGYSQWDRGGGSAHTVAGVGQVAPDPGDPTYGPLGTGPICEGQIASGLPLGTYILDLVPGAGINVLRGDLDLTMGQNAFAVGADEKHGDQITFIIIEGGACEITRWASTRHHVGTGGGWYDIELDAAATGNAVTIESRQGGIQNVIVDFDNDVTLYYVAGVVAEKLTGGGGSIPATAENLTGNGTRLEIEFAGGLPDAGRYKIDLAANISCLTGDTDCEMGVLAGDTNNDRHADLIDMAQVKNMNGELASQNPRFDVNLDAGTINLIDMALVKSLNGAWLP